MLRRVLVCAALVSACGSKTGLRDLRFDASVPDDVAPVEPACRPLRLRTRVGVAAPLTIEVDQVTPRASGFMWSVRTAPARARATVVSTGSADATLTPDASGTWDLVVATPYTRSTGEPVQCPVTVLVDPADPLCPEYALVEPAVVPIPGSSRQIALDPAWSTARINAGGADGTGLVAADDPDANVAALLWEFSTTRDLAATAGELEGRVVSAVGATPVLVGREGSTHEGLRYRRSSFRVAALESTTAAVVRDRVARDVVGLNPGAYAQGFTAQRAFVIEVTTVLRPDEGRAVMILATAPEAFYDDPARATASRLADVTNATGLSRTGTALDVTCQRTTATRQVTADFLWLVDTSRSMEDDQERLGNTAERFFREMNSAGIDLRVGVVQAGSRAAGLDLDDPGFEWIRGSDPMGPQRLAYEVTYRPWRNDVADTLAPYPLEGQEEEPVAAGIVTTEAMDRRAPTDPTSRRSFRPDATRAAFFVTDEIGTNDDARFFALDAARWGATGPERVRGATRWYADRAFLTFAMANLFSRNACPSVENFVACAAVGNGGAYIPLNTALDAEVASALSRIVDAVAGAASEFTVDRQPVSSTLRVAVDDRLAPRSRADGFDWNQDARTIVFRGNTYRPRRGQVVRSAYFFWMR